MQQLIYQIAVSLEKRGFTKRSQNCWGWRNLTITSREHDWSFLANWTDGEFEEFTFFDFGADAEQDHNQFVQLLFWVDDRQRMIRFVPASEAA